MDIVILNDSETYTGIYGSHVVLNAVEDERGEYVVTDESLVIQLEDLVSTYVKVKNIKLASQHST